MTDFEKFKADVDYGLSNTPKTMSPMYFYDERGSELFVEIMNLPEYYLTRAELDIFTHRSAELVELFNIDKNEFVELIELGSGDGTKIKKLLTAMIDREHLFGYFPIDISLSSLKALEKMLTSELPGVEIKTQHGNYFEKLSSLKNRKHKKIIFFLGSNLGNQDDHQAAEFIGLLSENLHPGDLLVLGLDLIKSEDIVLPAYDDKQGVTRKFNLNLLTRINRELDADFDLSNFAHVPEYSSKTGIAVSYLESFVDQTVTIKQIGKSYYFEKNERLCTEISRKYSDEMLSKLIAKTDFKVIGKLLDCNQYFADYVLQKKPAAE